VNLVHHSNKIKKIQILNVADKGVMKPNLSYSDKQQKESRK